MKPVPGARKVGDPGARRTLNTQVRSSPSPAPSHSETWAPAAAHRCRTICFWFHSTPPSPPLLVFQAHASPCSVPRNLRCVRLRTLHWPFLLPRGLFPLGSLLTNRDQINKLGTATQQDPPEPPITTHDYKNESHIVLSGKRQTFEIMYFLDSIYINFNTGKTSPCRGSQNEGDSDGRADGLKGAYSGWSW